jgi:hypothetical protein
MRHSDAPNEAIGFPAHGTTVVTNLIIERSPQPSRTAATRRRSRLISFSQPFVLRRPSRWGEHSPVALG